MPSFDWVPSHPWLQPLLQLALWGTLGAALLAMAGWPRLALQVGAFAWMPLAKFLAAQWLWTQVLGWHPLALVGLACLAMLALPLILAALALRLLGSVAQLVIGRQAADTLVGNLASEGVLALLRRQRP